jgi:hypothetical protein
VVKKVTVSGGSGGQRMTAQEVSHKSVAGSCVRWGQPWEVTEIALLDTNIKARKGLLGFFFFPEFELSPIL